MLSWAVTRITERQGGAASKHLAKTFWMTIRIYESLAILTKYLTQRSKLQHL
jgi:hypothetical protein